MTRPATFAVDESNRIVYRGLAIRAQFQSHNFDALVTNIESYIGRLSNSDKLELRKIFDNQSKK